MSSMAHPPPRNVVNGPSITFTGALARWAERISRVTPVPWDGPTHSGNITALSTSLVTGRVTNGKCR
jgi:hypothetical protein